MGLKKRDWMTTPKSNVVIWVYGQGVNEFKPKEAYICKRAIFGVGPNRRWTAVRMNGETIFHDSCGINATDLTKGIPRDCVKISVQDANQILEGKMKAPRKEKCSSIKKKQMKAKRITGERSVIIKTGKEKWKKVLL
jgi:hypothetical protein